MQRLPKGFQHANNQSLTSQRQREREKMCAGERAGKCMSFAHPSAAYLFCKRFNSINAADGAASVASAAQCPMSASSIRPVVARRKIVSYFACDWLKQRRKTLRTYACVCMCVSVQKKGNISKNKHAHTYV